MRALVKSPDHTPAAPRARILLVVGLLLAALAFAGLRTDSAAASAPCTPASDLLSIFPGFPLAVPAPTQASCFEGFDGNQIVPATGHTGHVDWQQIVANASTYEFVSVADDGGDSTFASDDKENDPGTWNITSTGSVPQKVDALAAATATDPVSNKTFVYAAFERLENVGNVFISFELNKNAAAPGQLAPTRSEGDVMISYEGVGSAIEIRMCKWHGDGGGESSDLSYGWYSLPGFGSPGAVKADSGSGDCTLLSGATVPTARGAMNTGAIANHIPGMGDPTTKKSDITSGSNQLTSIAGGTASLAVGNVVIGPGIPGNSTITSIVNASTVQISNNATATATNKDVHYMPNTPNSISQANLWGEAVINLSDALQAGGVANPCFDFGSVWLHTRSSDSFANSMQDLIRARPLQGARGCAIDIDKKVATQKAGDATAPAIQTIAGDTVSGSNSISGAFSTANMDVGDRVSGPGIPANSTIASIVDNDTFTISNNATATAIGVSLVVNPYHDGIPADPSFAAAGDTLHYLLTVTNPGQTPIANPVLTDTNCTGETVTKTEGANDTGAANLDPGDVWTYKCTFGPIPAGTASPVNNTGTVTGQVGVGICPQPTPSQTYTCLSDSDSVATTLRGGVSGVKFHDLNADGDRDAGEPGLGGWTIYADLNDNDSLDANEPSAVTSNDADPAIKGTYTINAIAAGTHTIREVQQANWNCSTPGSTVPADIPVSGANCEQEKTVVGGSNTTGADFGNYQNVSVSGVKFHDLNADGDRDAGEPGLGGWNIYVDLDGDDSKDAGEPEATTSNDADPAVKGTYTINGIKPGTYAVREVQQGGWNCSTPGSTVPADIPVSGANCESSQTFTSGAASTNVTFGNYQNVSQSGVKFHDLNADGDRDAGEPGLGGWNIYVDYDGDNTKDAGEPEATTSNDADPAVKGTYTISGIKPGTYAVREVQQAGWSCSTPGSTVPADIPVSGANCEQSRTFTSGATPGDVTFGNYQNVSVSGVKFHDLNADGDRDAGEPGLDGWNIYVDLDGDDSKDAGEPEATTSNDADPAVKGTYTINGVKPGTYAVREVQQAGWHCSTPGSSVPADIPVSGANCEQSRTFTSGATPGDVTFGNYQNVSQSGVKFHDLNADGDRDAGEPGLDGWNIYVDYDGDNTKDAGEPEATTSNDADPAVKGTYTINGIKPGTYAVREVQQGGWSCSTPGSAVPADIPVSGANCEASRTYTSGQTSADVVFGNYQNVSVSGVKFHDLNADGDRDAGEPGLGGWNIYIDYDGDDSKDAGEPEATTSNDADPAVKGTYTINGVKPGAYAVREVQQAGWHCSTPGSTVPADIPVSGANCEASRTFSSGATPADVTFGNYQNVSVSGVKFHDLNADGDRDAGEPGLGGWNIYVDLDGDDSKDAGEPEATTSNDADPAVKGTYTISGIKPGTYAVREVQQGGWNCSTPGSTVPADIPVSGANCEQSRTFTSGATPGDVTFGNYQNVSVSGVKFHDLNADGDRDAGEPGLGGWNIYVDYDGDDSKDAGEPEATTSNDADPAVKGTYTINGVKPGTYAVREIQQAGWHCSTPGSSVPADIPVSGANCEQSRTFTSGATPGDVTFGNYQNVSVSGVKFHDQNADGDRDAGEPGLGGWNIYVDLDGDNTKDAGEPEATTSNDADPAVKGTYTINGIKPGTYAVREIQQGGWNCSTPGSNAPADIPVDGADCEDSQTFTSGQASTDVTFGNYQNVSVSGLKFRDDNANGSKGAAEPGLGGWNVYVDYDGDDSKDAGEPDATTDANTGAYTISGIKPGTYAVREVQQAGWHCSTPNSGAGGIPVDGADCEDSQTFTSGQASTDVTFGNYQNGTVQITKVNQGGAAGDQFTFDPSTSLQNNSTTAGLDPQDGSFQRQGGQTQTFTGVKPNTGGSYTVAERTATGYRLTALDCDDQDSTPQDAADAGGLQNRQAVVNVQSGETVTCTFTNKAIFSSNLVVKAGNEFAYHGDTLSYSFAVTNTGDGPLSDVHVTDDHCPNVSPDPTSKLNDNGDGFLDSSVGDPTPETWVFTCTMPVPAHSDGEENPIVNTATATGRDEFQRQVTDTDTHSTRILHQAIDIEKEGPANATAGDLVPYTLTVTNPGETAFPAADVNVADPQCTAPPALQVKNRGGGLDPSPDTLDPGDAWIYSCSVQTSDGQQRVDNVSTVNGRDTNGRDATDTDTATTLLGERFVAGEQVEPGSARLAGRSGCVAKAFYVTVRGKQIERVTFRVDGKKRATLTSPDSKGRYRMRIDPRKLKAGAHRAVASVQFTEASNTDSKKLRVRFRRCVRRTAPAFTG